MSYTEELEKQNEELRVKLAATETQLHSVTRNYTSDDVLTAIVDHDKSFTYGLKFSAEQLLKRGDGCWCDRRDRLEYAIKRKVGKLNDNDIISMKIKAEEQTFFEKLFKKKPVVYVEVVLDINDPFGGDGHTRVYEQYFIDLVRTRSVTAMYQAVDEFQKKREETMSETLRFINQKIDEYRDRSGDDPFGNKITRIEHALKKIT